MSRIEFYALEVVDEVRCCGVGRLGCRSLFMGTLVSWQGDIRILLLSPLLFLLVVRIYFHAAILDRKIKFVDMLSAIGGPMELLT